MTSAKIMTLTLTLTLIYDPNPNPIPCEILDVEILDACADSPIVINFASHGEFRATPAVKACVQELLIALWFVRGFAPCVLRMAYA